jgi:UDP-glucose 4-epimerase
MTGSIAVVGANGFLGVPLTAALKNEGFQVCKFTRATPCVNERGRLSPDLVDADAVYWLATSVNPSIATSRQDLVAADKASFSDFLSATGDLSNPPLTILVSSGGTVYDTDFPPPYSETSRCVPSSAYGWAKLELETLLAAQSHGPHVSLRVANAYGPGQPTTGAQGVIAHWLAAATRGEDLIIYGPSRRLRDYVYIDDVVSAMVSVVQRPKGLPAVLNIGSGLPTSLGELADRVVAVTEIPDLAIRMLPSRSFDLPDTWLDITSAAELIEWKPRVSLVQGLVSSWLNMQSLSWATV